MLTQADVLERLTDLQALALTMAAEARGDTAEGGSSVEERIAVGCTCRNRLRTPRRFGDTMRKVCLQNMQFSCWNPGPDANHQWTVGQAYLLVTGQPVTDPILAETLFLAQGILDGVILDRVNGATHYYAPKAMKPAGRKPAWVFLPDGQEAKPVAIVGGHRFYRGV